VIDRDIDAMGRGSPRWREKEDLLVTFPGVGNTIARSVLADVPELVRLDRRKIASLIGVAPFTRRSGKWKGKSMIGGGRPAARSAIFLAAHSAIRCNPVLRAFYQRLLAQGKPKMVALIAVARKIVTILNAMLRDKKTVAARLKKNTVAEVRARLRASLEGCRPVCGRSSFEARPSAGHLRVTGLDGDSGNANSPSVVDYGRTAGLSIGMPRARHIR